MTLHPALEAPADGVAQFEDAGIGDGIEDTGTFAAPPDDACLGEGLEMAGGIGLAQAGGFDELGDVEFTGAQGLEKTET